MGFRRTVRSLSLPVVALTLSAACDSDEVFRETGTLRVSVVDRALVSQDAEPPGSQVAFWTLNAVELEIVGLGVFDYSPTLATCDHAQFRPGEVATVSCGVFGFAVEPDEPLGVSLRLEVSDLEVRRADRPVLPPGGDFDADAVLNDVDNCVLIPNPGQADINNDGFGNACSLLDANGDPTIPDRDGDGVGDFVPDNCLWITNPPQTDDSPPDGIGDVCEIITDVNLGAAVLDVVLGPVQVTVPGDGQQTVSADFDDRMTLVNCNPGLTSCDLDVSAIRLTSP